MTFSPCKRTGTLICSKEGYCSDVKRNQIKRHLMYGQCPNENESAENDGKDRRKNMTGSVGALASTVLASAHKKWQSTQTTCWSKKSSRLDKVGTESTCTMLT
jgi:hypothetical protein